MSKEKYRILSLGANYILKEVLRNGKETGVSLNKNKTDDFYKKFTNVLDSSFDTLELKKQYEKVLRSKFYFNDKHGFNYTLAVINVNFNYKYQPEKPKKNKTEPKAEVIGVALLEREYKEFENEDYEDLKDAGLIETEEVITETAENTTKEKYIPYVDENGKAYKEVNTAKLREILYENGFCVNGKKYVRFKRSAGSSREGKCLFIREELLKPMEKWGECDLTSRGDLVSWESYKALSLSSLKGFINIPLDGILVLKDVNSVFTENSVAVEKDENGVLSAIEKPVTISNNIWDGESLLDESVFTGAYGYKHCLLLRNKFFKSCAFKTKIQKWFKDNGVTDINVIKNAGGITLADSVDKIVMITTESSLKFLKFLKGGLTQENFEYWTCKINDNFGVVKYDKRTKFFGGRMVQSSYQLLNSIGLDYNECNQVAKQSVDFTKKLREDSAILKYYFRRLSNREKDGSYLYSDYLTEEDNELYDELDVELEGIVSDAINGLESELDVGLINRSEVIFKLLNINSKFENTELYYEFRNAVVDKLRINYLQGKLLFNGTNAVLFGNGPELLKASIGQYEEGNTVLKPGEIRTLRFANGEEVLCSRSPHITMGNVYLAVNKTDNEIWQYFDLGKNVVCINAVNENIQQRLNGCDYDSDSMLITNDKLLVDAAKRNYQNFKVPVCSINPEPVKGLSLAQIDTQTSANKIGDVVNLAQRLNSLIWEKLFNGYDFNAVKPIYNDVCILAVLSGMEIDKAKRTYGINAAKELYGLIKKYQKEFNGKPNFFKLINAKGIQARINKENEIKKLPKRLNVSLEEAANLLKDDYYRQYETPMDFIYNYIKKELSFNKGKPKTLKFDKISAMFKQLDSKPTSNDYYLAKEVVKIIKTKNKKIKALRKEIRLSNDKDNEVFYENIQTLISERNESVNNYITNPNVLQLALKKLEKGVRKSKTEVDEGETKQDNSATKKSKKVKKEPLDTDWLVYSALLSAENDVLEEVFKKSVEDMPVLRETADGDILLYGYNFKKEIAKK